MTFPGVRALDGVDFDVVAGEVHALIGENGAGKSTLVHILTGEIAPDAYEGEVRLDGAIQRLATPREAIESGIAVIPQELQLVSTLSAGASDSSSFTFAAVVFIVSSASLPGGVAICARACTSS